MRNPSTIGGRWELAAGAFYQTTLATGQEPDPHRTNVGTPLAPDVVVSATCSAVSQFNAAIKVTMKNLCEVMQVPSGAHLLASAEKAD